ncbi:MAG: sugar transferase [Pseudomonadota bacterium]
MLLFLTFIGSWILTYRVRYFIFDYYTHTFMTIWWSLFFSASYLFIIKTYGRMFIAIIYLLITLIFMITYRFIYARLRQPPIHVLIYQDLRHKLSPHRNVLYHSVQNIDDLKLKNFDCILFEYGTDYSNDWRKLIAHAQIIGIPVLTPSTLEEYLTGKVSVKELNASWIKNSFSINPVYSLIKKIFDIAITLILLPFLSIISLTIGTLIFICMGRPIFFSQMRIGQGGKLFKLYKFRTMINSNDLDETSRHDKRITKLGHILRQYRLDELPQFFNILKNEMSLIGPRPERVDLTEKYTKEIPIYNIRLLVKPGISGWSQVMYGYSNGVNGALEKLQYDLFYVKHFSMWIDIRIFFKTIYTIIGKIGI